MGTTGKRNTGGGFNFDDEKRPKKPPKFAFTVEEVNEEEISRVSKPASADAGAHEGADPGRFEWPMVAIVLALLPLVYWLQQWTRSLHGETLSSAPAEVRRSEEVRDPGVAEITVMSKIAVKIAFIYEQQGARQRHLPLSAQKDTKGRDRGGSDDESLSFQDSDDEEMVTLDDIEAIAWSRTDRLRAAIVAGELDGARAALSRIETLKAEAEPDGDLAAELHWLTMVYEKGPDAIPREAAESLESRHGWFGRLALSFGKHPSDELRWGAVAGGKELARGMLGLIGVLVALSLIGLVVAVLLLLKFRRTGYLLRFDKPEPGGSVFLETFGIFLGGFAFLILIELMLFGLGVEGTTTAACIHEVLLWSLVGTVVWPMIRRMPRRQWLAAVGWHKGEGISKEIGAGLIGYLGSQPIVWIGAWLGNVVEKITETAEPEASFGYGMFEVPAQGSWTLFILGILSAVLWAPIVEETIFRGSLFRYLSGRMSLVWSTLVSAAVFGFIHPYTPSGLIQVASSGLVFGFMRAWRGSLIAPVTAHAVHNAVVSSMSVSLIGMLGV